MTTVGSIEILGSNYALAAADT